MQPMEISMELIDACPLDGERVLAHYPSSGPSTRQRRGD
jgi:hypothetical protein